MKKILLVLGLVSFTISGAYASIDQNLKYGVKGGEVSELQEFLADKGLLTSNPTGFFGMMTLKAVRAYQVSQNLPSTGYVGVMTREKINAEIQAEIASSSEAEVLETGTTTPLVSTPTVTDFCPNIEGVQTGVPSGMFMTSEKGCFVPEVVTSINTGSAPTQVRNDPSTVTYTPPDLSSVDVRVVNTPYGTNFTTNDTVSFEVRAKNSSGNYIKGVEMFMKNSDGLSQGGWVAIGNDYYPFTFTPTKSGVQTVTFDIPSRGIKKDYQITIDPFVPIAPTAIFKKGSNPTFVTSSQTMAYLGEIIIDKKNQRIVPKDFEYEVISDTFTKEDITLYTCNTFIFNGKSELIYKCGTTLGLNYFPLTKPTKTGTFRVKISKLTLISNFDGLLNENNIVIDTTGWESQEVTVTK